MNEWLRLSSLAAASIAGAAAVTAYTILTIRSTTRRSWGWATYFAVLFISESLFTILYVIGLLTPPDQPSPFPMWLLTVFFLYAVPVSVGMSAFGWLALSRTTSNQVNTLIREEVDRHTGGS